MRLETFLVADAVSAPPDGKLYVHGGGVSRINAPMIPFAMQLGFLIRLAATEDELRQAHDFTLSFTDPAGNAIHPTIQGRSLPVQQIEPLLEGEERFAQLAFNVPNLTFNKTGALIIDFGIDGRPMRSIRLPIVAAS